MHEDNQAKTPSARECHERIVKKVRVLLARLEADEPVVFVGSWIAADGVLHQVIAGDPVTTSGLSSGLNHNAAQMMRKHATALFGPSWSTTESDGE